MTFQPRVGRPPEPIIDGKKMCSRCKLKKPVTEFYRDSSMASGYASNCKPCRKLGRTTEERKDDVLRNKYGIGIAEYNRLYALQEGRCAICDEWYEVLSTDHCHSTKRVRGLLCRSCNVGLGNFKDNVNLLHAAIAYLEE